MEKTTSVPKNRWALLPAIVSFFFYASLLGIIASSELPPIKEPVFLLRNLLFRGQETAFKAQDPGLRFTFFKAYLPRKGCISFLTDHPYDPHHKDSELLQAAQGELAPLLLNAAPGEKTAFFFCSRSAIAAERVKSEGYRIIQILGDGKGLAEKIP